MNEIRSQGEGIPLTSTADVVKQTGATYRQLDYWTKQGWLKPDEPNPGKGQLRSWPNDEVRIARIMVCLVQAGLLPHVAASTARSVVWTGFHDYELGPGIRLDLDERELT